MAMPTVGRVGGTVLHLHALPEKLDEKRKRNARTTRAPGNSRPLEAPPTRDTNDAKRALWNTDDSINAVSRRAPWELRESDSKARTRRAYANRLYFLGRKPGRRDASWFGATKSGPDGLAWTKKIGRRQARQAASRRPIGCDFGFVTPCSRGRRNERASHGGAGRLTLSGTDRPASSCRGTTRPTGAHRARAGSLRSCDRRPNC